MHPVHLEKGAAVGDISLKIRIQSKRVLSLHFRYNACHVNVSDLDFIKNIT